jgi:hypothetical protein
MPDLFPSPDPIQSPKAYQDHLLGLLGDDDPAVVQAQTPSTLRTLATEAAANLFRRPEPAEWSVGECIAHVFDAEIVMSSRYRFVLAHDEPALVGYDQDLWVDHLHGEGDDIEAMLDLFESLRRANVALWNDTPGDRRQRAGMHAERGPESYELSFLMIAGHDRFHVTQARRALEAFPRS